MGEKEQKEGKQDDESVNVTKGNDDEKKESVNENADTQSMSASTNQKASMETIPETDVNQSNPYPTPTSPNDADANEWAGAPATSSSVQQSNNGFDQAPVPDDGLGF